MRDALRNALEGLLVPGELKLFPPVWLLVDSKLQLHLFIMQRQLKVFALDVGDEEHRVDALVEREDRPQTQLAATCCSFFLKVAIFTSFFLIGIGKQG